MSPTAQSALADDPQNHWASPYDLLGRMPRTELARRRRANR